MNLLVSICIPTYQHGSFIAQTLAGCISQQTNFQYEIVIGDDGSTDEAPRIIADYSVQFPNIIRSYLHKKNLGPSSPIELGGKNNVIFLFSQCRGKYIALCEGDDYWTDPLKLQKQVDFLETNPEVALTHHQVEVYYENGSPSHQFNPPDQRTETTIIDLLSDTWYVATCSSVFRNVYQDGLPSWFFNTGSGDLGIFLIAAHHGKIQYFNQSMGVYRRHRGGLSNFQHQYNRFFLENRLKLYQEVNEFYGGIYAEAIHESVDKYENLLSKHPL